MEAGRRPFMSIRSELGHPARLVLVTEDPSFVDVVNKAILSNEDLSLVGYTGDPKEIDLLLREVAPDCCLVDHSLSAAGGVQVAEQVARSFPDVWVFLLTDSPSRELWSQAMARGIRQVIQKPGSRDKKGLEQWAEDELVDAVERTLQMEGEQIRRLEGRSAPVGPQVKVIQAAPKVIAVWTAKGGVGKTNVATNLALWAQTNPVSRVQTALLDLEEGAGGTHVLLDMPSTPTVNDWVDQLGMEEVDEAAVRQRVAFHRSGLMAVFQPDSLFSTMAVQDQGGLTRLIIRSLRAAAGLVVVDCAPSLTDAVGTALEMANVILVVVEPTVTCLYKTQQALQDIAQSERVDPSKFRLVINKMPQRSKVTEKEITTTLKMVSLGTIPYDPDVTAAQNDGKPLAIYKPNGPFMQGLKRVAAKVISGVAPAEAEEKRRAGFFARLMGRAV
ncbi:MAG: AAA family ATPase [Clostridia bacterium]|nr:AAA family ATPase [Clostridia bacterium]